MFYVWLLGYKINWKLVQTIHTPYLWYNYVQPFSPKCSYCEEHPWVVTQYQPGKKSIFAFEDEFDEGQAAQDSGDDETLDGEDDNKNALQSKVESFILQSELQREGIDKTDFEITQQEGIDFDSRMLPCDAVPAETENGTEGLPQTIVACEDFESLKRETTNGCHDGDCWLDDASEPQDGNDGKKKESMSSSAEKG